jgi:hypothetical protein
MKKIITLLLFIPILTLAQSEREQKTTIRNNSLSNSNRNFSTESDRKGYERENNFRNHGYSQPRNFGYYDPFFYNRWYRWGAPSFGYSFYDRWFYYDNLGFRQPARIYFYNDGKKDTIRGKKTHIRTGISYTTHKQIGGWLTIGNKNYFISEYITRNPQDISTYYDDVTMDMVLGWNDVRSNDIVRENIFYFGAGRKTDTFNYHVLIGIGKEKINYQYYDDLLILSNNGFYSFRNYSRQFTSLKFGIMKDFKIISLKGDYDVFRRNFNLGLGIIW